MPTVLIFLYLCFTDALLKIMYPSALEDLFQLNLIELEDDLSIFAVILSLLIDAALTGTSVQNAVETIISNASRSAVIFFPLPSCFISFILSHICASGFRNLRQNQMAFFNETFSCCFVPLFLFYGKIEGKASVFYKIL